MDLTLVTGPMFAGKTTYLMNALKESKCSTNILVTHSSDTRFSKGEEIINHDGYMIKHPILRVSTLAELPDIDKDAPVFLGIDEAQFFPDIVKYIRNLWEQKYKRIHIVVCGLNGDFQQKPFGVEPNWISQLISIASDCVCLKARCWKCDGPASFSIRKPECDSSSQVLVGGADIYTAACKEHYCMTEDVKEDDV